MIALSLKAIDRVIHDALAEDMQGVDISSEHLFGDEETEAVITAKDSGIVSGIAIAQRLFKTVDADCLFKALQHDGAFIDEGDVVAIVKGDTKAVLRAERPALNIMQRMSGISTATHAFVEAVKGTRARIYDTRKTAPGLRALDKLAVTFGCGCNHRMSLSDQVLLKDNHIAAASGITDAVATVREKTGEDVVIGVEVETFEQFEEALETSCDIILLDNMNLETMRACVKRNAGRKSLEASGNVTLERVADIAATGVDRISIGALTHSVKAFDLSMSFSPRGGGSHD